MNDKSGWFWFGVTYGADGHIKMRQYHVVSDGAGMYRVESWSKGIAGKLWHITSLAASLPYELAMAMARKAIRKWAGAYVKVDEGDYEWARETLADSEPVPGDWWAQALEVDTTAAEADVKAAWREKVMRYHPDRAGVEGATPDQAMFIKVQAAWEHWKENVK